MNAELRARFTLRHALPTGILLVVLAMLVFSYVDSVVNGRAAVRQRARRILSAAVGSAEAAATRRGVGF